MAFVEPVTLRERGVRLEPLAHRTRRPARGRRRWRAVEAAHHLGARARKQRYIDDALRMRADGNRFAFAVVDDATGTVLGTTSYHDILPAVKRVEIGYTWYRQERAAHPRQHHRQALDDGPRLRQLGCHVVGWRTDNFNFASQRAIERLGAKKDGVIRGHALRRDGTIRDTVMYSMRAGEWPEAGHSCYTF
jgi:RimJ/RimL family protein N-acetyltransferase